MPRNSLASSEMWGITAYFNPNGSRRRLENYRLFRSRLALPLATVELTFGRGAELGDDDAEVLRHVDRGSLLWQKERLLRLALAALPHHCTRVVWLDADIVFEDSTWAERCAQLLDRFPLVQPFESAVELHPGPVSAGPTAAAPTRALPSLAAEVAAGRDCRSLVRPPSAGQGPRMGIAWAARRELLDNHGLYDACIIGGGDRALAGAGLGCLTEAEQALKMNRAQVAHYHSWAIPFFAEVGGEIAHAPGRVHHLWHAPVDARAYRSRHRGLARLDFDPTTDITIGADGAWCWSSRKPKLHAFVRNYFTTRENDAGGGCVTIPP